MVKFFVLYSQVVSPSHSIILDNNIVGMWKIYYNTKILGHGLISCKCIVVGHGLQQYMYFAVHCNLVVCQGFVIRRNGITSGYIIYSLLTLAEHANCICSYQHSPATVIESNSSDIRRISTLKVLLLMNSHHLSPIYSSPHAART